MSDTFLGGLDLETSIYVFQGVSTVLAIITNLFLVYVIKNHTRNQIGNYKYLLITFALFEAFYSVVVFIGMPTHFMADRTWLVFTSKGLLGGTKYAAFGPGLYCFLYDTWVELVVIHFIYRYIVVCKERWAYAINESRYLKFLIGLVYFTNLAYYALCAAGFCQHEKILPLLASKVRSQFGIEHPEDLGYILLRTWNAEGGVSIPGLMTIINHYVILIVAVIIILYCGICIWLQIKRIALDQGQIRHLRLQRQMFITLVIQTFMPLIFVHIPTLIYLTFPFWDDGFSFGKVSMVFSLLTSINKFCDPFIVICCINEYRKATAKILHLGCGSSIGATSSSSEDQQGHNTRTGATATTTHGTKSSIHNIGVVEIEYKGKF